VIAFIHRNLAIQADTCRWPRPASNGMSGHSPALPVVSGEITKVLMAHFATPVEEVISSPAMISDFFTSVPPSRSNVSAIGSLVPCFRRSLRQPKAAGVGFASSSHYGNSRGRLQVILGVKMNSDEYQAQFPKRVPAFGIPQDLHREQSAGTFSLFWRARSKRLRSIHWLTVQGASAIFFSVVKSVSVLYGVTRSQLRRRACDQLALLWRFEDLAETLSEQGNQGQERGSSWLRNAASAAVVPILPLNGQDAR